MITFDYIPAQRKGKLICSDDQLNRIRNRFSVTNPAAKYAKSQWSRNTPARLYAITPTGLFDIGLYKEIQKYLISENILDIEYTVEFKARIACGYGNVTLYDNLAHELRDYQQTTVTRSLSTGFGTIVVGTGGGKSLITASMVENIIRHSEKKDLKFIVIVPGIGLVSQLKKDFDEYNASFEYSIWTGKNAYRDAQVVICNTENLVSKFGKFPQLANVDVLMVDEVHGITSKNKISKIISKFKTPNRFGFTGTLPEDMMDYWKVIGTFGPILFEKNSKELRDEGYLVDVAIKIIKMNHGRTAKMDYPEELEYVYNHTKRNTIIRKLSGKLPNNTLILVNHLAQGENLLEELSTLTDKRVFFIKGETELDDRDDIKDLMAKHDNIVCIAMSKIFATGINIPNIHNLLFVAGGKAFIRTVQGIGRGLRLHPTKTKLTIIDIYDSLKYSTSHVEKRKEIYDAECIRWSETELKL